MRILSKIFSAKSPLQPTKRDTYLVYAYKFRYTECTPNEGRLNLYFHHHGDQTIQPITIGNGDLHKLLLFQKEYNQATRKMDAL